MESIKNLFNLKSLAHKLMWVGMAGMTLMMVGAVYPDATFLDWLISIPLHIVQGGVHLFTGGLDTLGAMWQNTVAGNILPNHLTDMFASAVTGTSTHTAAAAAGHLHGAAGAALTNQWQWFGSLLPMEQSKMIADAAFFGMPLDQYVSDWCADNGVTFAP